MAARLEVGGSTRTLTHDALAARARAALGAIVVRLRQEPPGLRMALALTLLLIVGLQWGLRPWLQAEARLAADEWTRRAHLSQEGPAAAQPPDPRRDAAAAIWSILPRHTAFHGDVDALVLHARKLDLPLPRAQLRRADSTRPVVVEEVDLELEAPYPLVRRYIARSLNDLPHASLKRLRLERGPAAAAAAADDAQGLRTIVTLRLHYRSPEAP